MPTKKTTTKPKLRKKTKRSDGKRSDGKRSDGKRSDGKRSDGKQVVKPVKPVKLVKSVKPVAPKFSITKDKGCCTDILKTGQAYSIPFGFKDVKGTQRIGEPEEPAVRRLGDKQTDSKPVMVNSSMNTEIPTMTDASTGGMTIRVPRQPIPPVTVQPNQSEVDMVRSAIPFLPRVPRRNSRQELEDRYEAITGVRYSGSPLNYQEFRFMVEQEDIRRTRQVPMLPKKK